MSAKKYVYTKELQVAVSDEAESRPKMNGLTEMQELPQLPTAPAWKPPDQLPSHKEFHPANIPITPLPENFPDDKVRAETVSDEHKYISATTSGRESSLPTSLPLLEGLYRPGNIDRQVTNRSPLTTKLPNNSFLPPIKT